MKTTALTKNWLRNRSDELAADNGCWFDPLVGSYPVWWIERYCKLYQGEYAGRYLWLRGCQQCDEPHPVPAEWNDIAKQTYLDRAKRHAACHRKGHSLDWKYECIMRLFGWQKHSEHWNRNIRRFTKGTIFISKKNGKSPVAAAAALYLTIGDGEPGQAVFLGAKDGTQARDIMGKHAFAMVEQSQELMKICTLNKNLMQISHSASRSYCKPMTSSNSRTQEAKEGLNGSAVIDELHVVDREFMGRINRMGISRSEPLLLEVSTAGADPDSYGKDRFDAGLELLLGNLVEEDWFFASYHAPQDLADADLSLDPIKYGKMANPSWGHTILESEFLSDYNASKRNLNDLAKFKMYRLNIWQSSDTPWLDMAAWARCQQPYHEVDLLGQECYAGLDLAKTRDTCALVLNFPMPDNEYRQLAYFWVPRQRAEALRDKVPYLSWAAQGWLELIDGDTIDFNIIRHRLMELKKKFKITKMAYDDLYAAQMIQRLVEEDRAFRLEEVCAFAQTITDFAGPTDEYEGLVREGKLHHNGNSLLTSQAGNTRIRTDCNQNKRPVKPKPTSLKTIDGVVSGIMALELARTRPMRQLNDWYYPGILTS